MDLKKISEIFAISVPPLILCSCLRLITYYYHWNIPIFDYLSTSELLFAFVQPGIIMIGLIGVYILGNLLLWGLMYFIIKKKTVNSNAEKQTNVEGAPEKKEVKLSKKQNIIFNIILVLIISITIYSLVRGALYDYNVSMVVMLHVTTWLFLILGIQNLFFKQDKTLPIPILISTILTLVSASYFYGRFQIRDTSINPISHVLSLDSGEQIETNKKILYLGKVENYYFLFDSTANSTIVLPSNRIKKDILKNGSGE